MDINVGKRLIRVYTTFVTVKGTANGRANVERANSLTAMAIFK